VTEWGLGDNAMLPPSLFASRSVVGANLFTALLYGPFTVMLTLIPFVMIRGAHLPTLVAGLAFIPLQVLITVVSPLAGMLCRRFGRRLPLFAGGAVVALGCAMALCVGPNATYWADIFPNILLLALGMSLAIAPLTTLVLTSVESDRAGTAVSRAGSLFAIALLGGGVGSRAAMACPHGSVPPPFHVMARRNGVCQNESVSFIKPTVLQAGRCSAVLRIPHGDGCRRGRLRSRHARGVHYRAGDPTSTSSGETDPFGVRNQQAGKAGRKQ
jgi:hypothetical protein